MSLVESSECESTFPSSLSFLFPLAFDCTIDLAQSTNRRVKREKVRGKRNAEQYQPVIRTPLQGSRHTADIPLEEFQFRIHLGRQFLASTHPFNSPQSHPFIHRSPLITMLRHTSLVATRSARIHLTRPSPLISHSHSAIVSPCSILPSTVAASSRSFAIKVSKKDQQKKDAKTKEDAAKKKKKKKVVVTENAATKNADLSLLESLLEKVRQIIIAFFHI